MHQSEGRGRNSRAGQQPPPEFSAPEKLDIVFDNAPQEKSRHGMILSGIISGGVLIRIACLSVFLVIAEHVGCKAGRKNPSSGHTDKSRRHRTGRNTDTGTGNHPIFFFADMFLDRGSQSTRLGFNGFWMTNDFRNLAA
ncbi:MAG TPA: hypothetical protein PKH37_09190 [Alphaproteobacteria bacterium]|nr:hypothetical protein [Alphaproteobacteria bacterium]